MLSICGCIENVELDVQGSAAEDSNLQTNDFSSVCKLLTE